MKKCTVGSRHKWAFVKNVETKTMTLNTVRFTMRGVYRCECGAKKYGDYVSGVKGEANE